MRVEIGDDIADFVLVRFNGEKADACTVADEERGYVVRHVLKAGHRESLKGWVYHEETVAETIYGKVEVTLHAGAPNWAVEMLNKLKGAGG